MRIILASGSKQRQEILKMIGLKFEVVVSDTDENIEEENPAKFVEQLSLKKGKAVSNKIEGQAIIIAADTIIYFNGKKYEKPKSKEEAFEFIKEFSGNKSIAYTGITVIDLYNDKTITTSSKVDVYFKNISDEEINWYVNTEKRLLNCCGYAPEGKAAIFIDKIDGDYNTLIGISPSVILDMLKELGYTINDFDFE